MRLGVAGKGGSGKTTFTALMVNWLLKKNKKPILCVDADPNHSLGETLGVKNIVTLMDKVDELQKVKDKLPPGVSKTRLWEFGLQEVIIEREGFDLLVMGRTEGPGCYCTANTLLRMFMEKISANYPYLVMDNEAGMEHLSRRTSGVLDHLFIVANPHPASLRSAERIWTTTQKLRELKIREKWLVLISTFPGYLPSFSPFLEPIGHIPFDKKIYEFSINETSLLKLPLNNPAQKEVGRIMEKIL